MAQSDVDFGMDQYDCRELFVELFVLSGMLFVFLGLLFVLSGMLFVFLGLLFVLFGLLFVLFGLLFVLFGCLLFVLFGCYSCCSVHCLCVNVYCHRVTQLQLINISYHVINQQLLGCLPYQV
jgi:hypothetical protein